MLTHLQHWQRINICHNALLQVLTRRGGHANMYGKLLSNMLFSPFFALFCFFFFHLLDELFLHALLFVLREQGVTWELKAGVAEGLY